MPATESPVNYADRISATGQVQYLAVNLAGTRLRQIIVCPTGSAGSFVLRDGGAGGQVRLPQVDTPASAGAYFVIDIPADGLVFQTSVHATISNCALVCAFG